MDKLSVASQKYLKKMFEICQLQGSVRVKDLANLMKVKPPSVVEGLGILEDCGLVEHRKRYARGIALTKKGLSVGRALCQKHEIVKRFFIVLGLEEEDAKRHACRIEHEMDLKVMKSVKRFVAYAEQLSKDERGWLQENNGPGEGGIMNE